MAKRNHPNNRASGRGRETSGKSGGEDGHRIFGLHAATEALKNPNREIISVQASRNAAARLAPELQARNLSAQITEPRDLDRLLGKETVHQGICLAVAPLPLLDLADLAEREGTIVVLDQVTDPRNVGAIIRIAAAFAATGLVVTRRHRPAETGLLAKAASGGLEHVPICEVPNLARALEHLQDAGVVVVGLDSDGSSSLEDLPHAGKRAIVLGAEGSGLRRLTRENCDHIARLAFPGAIRSINVATAAALALQTMHGTKTP